MSVFGKPTLGSRCFVTHFVLLAAMVIASNLLTSAGNAANSRREESTRAFYHSMSERFEVPLTILMLPLGIFLMGFCGCGGGPNLPGILLLIAAMVVNSLLCGHCIAFAIGNKQESPQCGSSN